MLVMLASASVVRMERNSILTTLADANRTRLRSNYCLYTVSRYPWW